MYGVENRFKMQLLLGLKGSPLVGVRIVNFVPPDAGPVRVPHAAVAAAALGGHSEARRHGPPALFGWSLGHWFVASR